MSACSQSRPPKLYVLAVGASRYKDSRFNLKYAAKDARDLADHLAARRERFAGVETLVLLDEAATRESILSARTFLVQNQGTLLAMVSRLSPPLIKGGEGGFTGKVRHAQRGLLNMH